MSRACWRTCFLSAVLASLLLAPKARSEDRAPEPLSGAEIRAELVGRPLAGIYPHGTVWSETVLPDGTTDYLERGSRHAGQWRLEDRLFCFSYPVPLMGGCFEVFRLSPNCYDLYAWSTPLLPGEPRRRLNHNGKMWRADQPATCDEHPSV
jgi:hypothetical protein